MHISNRVSDISNANAVSIYRITRKRDISNRRQAIRIRGRRISRVCDAAASLDIYPLHGYSIYFVALLQSSIYPFGIRYVASRQDHKQREAFRNARRAIHDRRSIHAPKAQSQILACRLGQALLILRMRGLPPQTRAAKRKTQNGSPTGETGRATSSPEIPAASAPRILR